MRTPSDQPRQSIRMDARLDATTRAKVDKLAIHFHQPRAAVLCHIMEWGLSRDHTGSLNQDEARGPVYHLSLAVASSLYARVQKAAAAAGVKTAPWLRPMVRQISITNFPASWQEERSGERSHDSTDYDTCFMLRLDEASRAKLHDLVEHFHRSKAHIIRQLIVQATLDDFPNSWQMRAEERRAKQARQNPSGKHGNSSPPGVSSGSSHGLR